MTSPWLKKDPTSMHSTPDVIVLCGGAGLRLRSVTGANPKSMASVAGDPFLALLLRQLNRSGFRRVILAVGYQQQAIRSFFGDRFEGVDILYSSESAPLGTGGAMRNAADLVNTDAVVVMNGDSYTDADLDHYVRDYCENAADVSMIVVPSGDREDCGNVNVDSDGNVVRFGEKTPLQGSRYINAGIYMLPRRIVQQIPTGSQISLEKELIPRWLDEGVVVRAYCHQGRCLDIGTPDRYSSAKEVLRDAERVVTSASCGVSL
jgi:NDP-sugar pyrophosphorylase family protein